MTIRSHPVLNCAGDNRGAINSSSDANLEEWFTSASCYGKNYDVINEIRTTFQGINPVGERSPDSTPIYQDHRTIH
jgi:hypothetical protein